MKACFSTWCTDDYHDRVGLAKQQASLKYFHPEIPRFVFDTAKTNKLKEIDPWLNQYFMMPPTCMHLADEFDLVIHIDGDCTVTGPLDDVLRGDFEIAGVRNNNDYNKAGKDPFITIPLKNGSMIPKWEFLNAGFVASTSKDFWLEWHACNKLEGNNYAGHENDTLNHIFHSGRYKTKILDPYNCSESYGLTNVWGNETHWDSWREIFLQDNKLYIHSILGRRMEIKVLHVAGGGGSWLMKQKYEQYGFKQEVLEYLRNITNG
tara:strand:- start:5305 stop:6093 length:789 start_codon:yes stop_codon:yes gene_type:complete